jgi:hypothetical protein
MTAGYQIAVQLRNFPAAPLWIGPKGPASLWLQHLQASENPSKSSNPLRFLPLCGPFHYLTGKSGGRFDLGQAPKHSVGPKQRRMLFPAGITGAKMGSDNIFFSRKQFPVLIG